jgi:type II secretion system protein G
MSRSGPQNRGFTLVEMLVVIGIVAVLAALLLPAVMMALNHARRAAIVIEIGQLNDAVETYKDKMGDYPPNFRDYEAFIRHVRRCYPKIDQTHLNTVIQNVWGTNYSVASPPPANTPTTVDEGESLVFWLSKTRDDPRFPFTASGSAPYRKFYEFDETRLVDATADGGDNDGNPSFRAKNSKETFYIYIDSRSYDELSQSTATYAFAEDTSVGVQPYWSDTVINSAAATRRLQYKPMNATTFQIICAGQDGEFGHPSLDGDVMVYPAGEGYTDEAKDNITNFSGGRLEDKIP